MTRIEQAHAGIRTLTADQLTDDGTPQLPATRKASGLPDLTRAELNQAAALWFAEMAGTTPAADPIAEYAEPAKGQESTPAAEPVAESATSKSEADARPKLSFEQHESNLRKIAERKANAIAGKHEAQSRLNRAQAELAEALDAYHRTTPKVTPHEAIRAHINHEQEIRAKKARGEIPRDVPTPRASVVDAVAARYTGADSVNARGGRAFARLPKLPSER